MNMINTNFKKFWFHTWTYQLSNFTRTQLLIILFKYRHDTVIRTKNEWAIFGIRVNHPTIKVPWFEIGILTMYFIYFFISLFIIIIIWKKNFWKLLWFEIGILRINQREKRNEITRHTFETEKPKRNTPFFGDKK